ncbi:MAG: hypothetical protein A3G34_16130 [Candidatus Lindowbacteria bacterium RIFCSPLOWO2_12_FULL_62_27]|nr:MAG: hypothetical protein A3I06_12325 [Candidatus Lindowbacteria bacterium RIFCSPLOWO2_02_FULL_62_12]OGH61152.1 MAG: hypothetical protein A3G34_16130 [Candidatus Lindowbacteria bacterium RIFCSPLOWO2_12_FULL_62_27]
MLNSIIEKSLNRRLWVILAFGALAALSLLIVPQIPIDAVPDITPVQVVVNTLTGGIDPEQIEKTVSTPIESEMGGIANVEGVRSLSKNGLSQVVVIFEDGTDIYWARQQVSERMQSVKESLPEGLSPELAPITTGLGEVLMYVVLPKPGTPLAQKDEVSRLLYLRTVQDFIIRRHLKSTVANVAEVDANGGFKKEIHIDVDPARLNDMGLSIEDIVRKLETVGESFGGGYIQHEGRQVIVRTTGALNLDRLRQIALKLDVRGRPVLLREVAAVREDFVQRQGAATYGGEETVLGTVLMRIGANSRQVARDAERVLSEIPLPDDVEVKILYSRRFLVEATIHTVATNLAEGAALVVIILLLILGNIRAALIISLTIPLAMMYAAVGMKYFGISANLMSLGAIDFGLLVDAAVVIVENVVRHLAEKRRDGTVSSRERLEIVLGAVKEVIAPVTLGRILVMAVYLPIFALEGIEGKLFRPMVEMVLLALTTSFAAALVLMPVLAYLTLRAPRQEHREPLIFGLFQKAYRPVLKFSLNYRWPVVIVVAGLAAWSALVYLRLGADFMPPLDEGDLVVNFIRDSSIALDESVRVQKASERVIKRFDEVENVFARLGTPESATDPMGVHLADVFVILNKDKQKWPVQANGRRRSKEELFEAIQESVTKEISSSQEIMASQPIEMRFGEILEGTRADVSLRIYGPDLDKLTEMLETARQTMESVRGAAEVELDPLTALRKSPTLDVRPDDKRMAQYGVDLGQVNWLLETAMGGRRVGSFYEQQWRFPIVVRLDEKFRENPKEIARLPVGLPEGGVVPLSALADINERDQVTTIAHDRNERYAAVAINLSADRDIESFVREAKETLAKKLEMPPGYRLSWGGQFKNLERARARLGVIVPLTLVVIFIALLSQFGRLRQALLIYLSIPFAMTGGVFSLYLRDIPFSVSAAVGFIALTGIAILNAMVLVTFFNQLRQAGKSLEEAVTTGAELRLRPVLMTALVAGVGFLPMALNTGIGAEVQRPLATVVIGGIFSSTLLTLLVLPTLYLWVEPKAHHPFK